jgi:hypothetical protein
VAKVTEQIAALETRVHEVKETTIDATDIAEDQFGGPVTKQKGRAILDNMLQN